MTRRRRNPISINWLPWVIVAGVAYWLWSQKNKLTGPGSIFDSATTSIANLFPGTSPSVQVLNTVLMPDGSTFPASSLTSLNFQTINGQAQFTVNGAQYALTPQVNGVYQAIAI
jgi:hypothetical protein